MDDYDVALATMDDDGFGCAITESPDERKLPPWQPATNGRGKRTWFLYRDDQTPVRDRWYFSRHGDLIRYASCETAQRAADKLNELAVRDLPDARNGRRDGRPWHFDAAVNRYVFDDTGN